jgi:hypothetical protein
MLTYTGFIELTPHLCEDEVVFLNNWQNRLNSIYHRHINDYGGSRNFKNLSTDLTCEIDSFLGLSLSKEQHWTIMFCFSPMIHFSQEGIMVYGSDKKGQFRDAVLAYQHFFLGETSVLRDACYEHLSFIKQHAMNGIISCENTAPKDLSSTGKWCYLIEDNIIGSVNAPDAQAWLARPEKYEVIEKEDTTFDKLSRYFPPLMLYAKINRSTLEKLADTENSESSDSYQGTTFKI